MANKTVNTTKKNRLYHREDALWLTMEICIEYENKAKPYLTSNTTDTGSLRLLREELQKLCDIPEVMAYNILRGMHVGEYVVYYERLKNGDDQSTKLTENDRAYIDFLDQYVAGELGYRDEIFKNF